MSSTYSTILTEKEQFQLYAKPLLGPREQEYYFILNDQKSQVWNSLQSAFQKSHFILLLRYFKANKVRLNLTWGQIKDDPNYIYQRYYPEAPRYRKNLSNRVRLRMFCVIFRLLEY